MLGFSDAVLCHANGKIYGRVNSGTTVVEAPLGHKARRDGLLAVCVVSALSLLLATTSVVLNVVVTRESSVSQMGQQGPLRICVPCFEARGLSSKESDMESLERLFQDRSREGTGRRDEKYEEDGGLCCAEDANQLETILNEILDEKKDVKTEETIGQRGTGGAASYPACDLSSVAASNGTACLLPPSLSLNPTPAAAHLVSLGATTSATADGLALTRWNINSRRSFCRRLNCNSTHLLPSHAGHYFVYSQVSFSFPSTPDQSFSHLIKRFNTRNPNGGVELLMQHSSSIRGHTQSSSSPSSHPITDSSFLGGIVRVYPNDKLYVEVSHHQALRSLPTATVFGMYKLS